jgi:hypothetical protein
MLQNMSYDCDYGRFTGHPMDPRTTQDDNDPEYIKEQAAEAFTDAVDAADPAALLPVDGPVKEASVAALLTWISEDAAKLLLIACSRAGKFGTADAAERNEATARALRAFTELVAREYADDNWVAA